MLEKVWTEAAGVSPMHACVAGSAVLVSGRSSALCWVLLCARQGRLSRQASMRTPAKIHGVAKIRCRADGNTVASATAPVVQRRVGLRAVPILNASRRVARAGRENDNAESGGHLVPTVARDDGDWLKMRRGGKRLNVRGAGS